MPVLRASFLRSLNMRMIMSHIFIAVMTSCISALLLTLIATIYFTNENGKSAYYQQLTAGYGLIWLMGHPTGQPIEDDPPQAKGFSMVINSDGQVVHTYGNAPCAAEDRLADCAPHLADLEAGQQPVPHDDQTWTQTVIDVASGHRLISERAPFLPEVGFILGEHFIYGNVPFMLTVVAVTVIAAIPIAWVLVMLFVRPLMRRVTRITRTSKAFADGDFQVRVDDMRQDEIGTLAQQFDTMADVLEQNIHTLRDLVQRNAELVQQVETSATQAERSRLSRDLHDSLAQRLFSLSFNASALADLAQKHQVTTIHENAQRIAQMAEAAQLDLRTLIVELRPSNQPTRNGLSEAMQSLCKEWQHLNNTPVECNLVLRGDIPAGLQDIIYRGAQEALNNIAKHAHAHHVSLTVLEGNNQITLSVTDDGIGFDTGKHQNGDGSVKLGKLGLMGMQERARSVGGNIYIESDTQQGTTIRLVLPLQREEAIL